MLFCDKLIRLRREKGLSQEQLANLLNVTRQSVSKWEAGQSMPELAKLVQIGDIFQVSLDYLVRDWESDRERSGQRSGEANEYSDRMLEEIHEYVKQSQRFYEYEYKSQICLFGLPLVHVHLASGVNRVCVARGIIAVGNVSIGVISIGGVALGGICLGGCSLGLLALGGMAAGGIALGGVALGLIALGGVSIGLYSIGGMAVAKELAVGGAASGRVAVGNTAAGQYALQTDDSTTAAQIVQFCLEHGRGFGRWLAGLFSWVK